MRAPVPFPCTHDVWVSWTALAHENMSGEKLHSFVLAETLRNFFLLFADEVGFPPDR